MLHSVELSVQQLLLVVCVLELPEDGHVDEVELLLHVEVALLVVLCSRQAFLHVPPQPLQVHVQVSLQRRQMLVHNGFDHPFLELVELLVWIVLAQAFHLADDPVHLLERVGKSAEGFVDSAVEATDLLEIGALRRDELWVLAQGWRTNLEGPALCTLPLLVSPSLGIG